MAHLGKGALRVAKNYTKGYSDVQSKVRDATSNDPWGPSGTQMNELSALTYNQHDFVEIMEMLDKRLNDKGKNWRHVFKALTVLDYILHSGSENVVIYWRDNAYLIKTLKEFQYVDEQSKDQGANVRQKAKDISNLLADEARLRQERRGRSKMRDQLLRGEGGDGIPPDDGEFEGAVERRRTKSTPGGRRSRKDEEDLNRAIELSKKSLAEEQAKQGQLTAEEQDLLKALKLSEEEEAARAKAVEDANSRSLFDDNAQLTPANPFPGLQPQFTQLQPQFTAMPMQQQFTSFNPYAQMAQQQAMQDQWMSQQAEWQAQQQAQLQAQQQAQLQAQQQAQLQAQQQAQQQAQLQAQQQAQLLAQQQAEQQLAQQQAEWAAQQQLLQQQQQQQQQAQFLAQQQAQAQFLAQQQQQQPLLPQATAFGSNNPFAFGAPQAQQPSPAISSSPPPSSTPAFTTQASPSPGFQPSPSPISAPASSVPKVRTDDGQHAHLANLFANRDDGLDTFGNIGALRFGHTAAGRLQQVKTGPASSNPFSQMTGPAGQQQPAHSDQPFFSI